MRNIPFIRRSVGLLGALGLVACASAGGSGNSGAQAAATKPAEKPGWVAGPSAALPEGFPAPGPLDQVIVKQYPAYRMAILRAERPQRSANGMFYPLFNHIKKNDIAMTAPVEMQYRPAEKDQPAGPVAMAFLYGKPTLGEVGADGAITVEDVPAATVLSVGVRGSYTAERFEAGYAKLQAYLKEHGAEFKVAGPPRYLAYNSPFVPGFLRYGEVQVPVERISK